MLTYLPNRGRIVCAHDGLQIKSVILLLEMPEPLRMKGLSAVLVIRIVSVNPCFRSFYVSEMLAHNILIGILRESLIVLIAILDDDVIPINEFFHLGVNINYMVLDYDLINCSYVFINLLLCPKRKDVLFLFFSKWIDTERLNVILCIRVIPRRIGLACILHVVVKYT